METGLKKHYGHNIKRLRDILGIKQDAIAMALNMSQQTFSHLEQKASIEEETLKKIADFMKIPVKALENFSEEGIINIISSTLHDNSGSVMYNPSFNPMDKIIELYERIIQEKDAKIAALELK